MWTHHIVIAAAMVFTCFHVFSIQVAFGARNPAFQSCSCGRFLRGNKGWWRWWRWWLVGSHSWCRWCPTSRRGGIWGTHGIWTSQCHAKRGGDAHLYGPCLQWHWGCSNCRCQPFSDLVQMPESNFQGIQWVTSRGGCTGRVFGYLWEAEQRFGRYVLCGCFFPGRQNMFAFLQSYRITICSVSSPVKVFKYSSVLLCVCFYCVFQLFPQGNKRPREKGVLLGKKPSAAAFSWFPWILFSPCTSGLAKGCVPEPGTKKVGQHGETVKRTELRWRALNFVQQLQILHVRVSRGAYISRVRLLSKCTRSLVRAWMFLCFVEQYRSELVASNGGLPSLEWFRKEAFFFTKDLSC